ncbi:MAG: DNA polymerase III subunit beta [Parcubacteria group bacterium]|nr:DNA polymerase III subunit beta [Parcubacteria group bacterium]
MKIIITKENFLSALDIAGHISANNKVSLPILNGIMLEARKGGLGIIGTNLEIAIRAETRAKVEVEGRAVVPSALLINYVTLQDEGPIELSLDSSYMVIKTNNGTTKCKTYSQEDFPIVPQIQGGVKYRINNSEFAQALSRALSAINSSESRSELSGVFLGFNKDRGAVVVVGTDGFRLAETKIAIKGDGDVREVIIPQKTAQELTRVLKKDGEVSLCVEENQISCADGNFELVSRLVGGKFPNYAQIIPAHHETRLTFKVSDFIRAIKKAGLFSKKNTGEITLDAQKNSMDIFAFNDEVGEMRARTAIDFNGEPVKIIVNHRYLLDGLQNIEGDDAMLDVVNATAPLTLRTENKKNFLYLIMPLKQ